MGGGGRSIQNIDPHIYEVNWDCPKKLVPFKTQYGQNIITLKVYPSITDTMPFFSIGVFFYSKMAMTKTKKQSWIHTMQCIASNWVKTIKLMCMEMYITQLGRKGINSWETEHWASNGRKNT